MSFDSDIILEFVVECREGLDRIDVALVALDANLADTQRLDVIFRALHTIKGNAGFLNFPKLGALTHAGESLLSKQIKGEAPTNSETIELLFRLVDAVRQSIAEIEENHQEGMDGHAGLLADLAKWTKVVKGDFASTVTPLPAKPKSKMIGGPAADDPAIELKESAETSYHTPEQVADPAPTPPPQPPLAARPAEQSTPLPKSEPAVQASTSDSSADSTSAAKLGADPESSTVIRVQINHLDDLMNLVGELVLTRNRIVQVTENRADDELTEPIQRLNRLTAALQDGVMRTRMQPVRNAWKKYPRIVRDLAKQSGKLCEVEFQGGDTELDKSMLEAIADPLVHLVRNSIDHGIEKPYLRRIKGKPETGRLLVKAFQESGQVHIEISDDGAGLDLERIRKKAVEIGVIGAERARTISETDLRNSIFLPGFTTADRVTSLSGRGVGMDVVKTCVEEIGGTIELQTKKDVGTTIRLTVPLTLAIVPAIMVVCGEQRFAIPQINVVEMLRLEGEEKQLARERFYDTPVLRLRGELLQTADLCETLQIPPRADFESREKVEILVLKTGTRRFALVVDEIGDAQEIVVKPLGELLAAQGEYSGAALMGDGTIALILDVLGIARCRGLLASEQSMLNDSVTTQEHVVSLDQQVLICAVDGERQIALSLTDVISLERVPATSVEHSDLGDMLQCRDELLPLYHLSKTPPPAVFTDGDERTVSIVVYRVAQSKLGLLVERIIDVAPMPGELLPAEPTSTSARRDRVYATAVVLGRVTDFLQIS